MSLIAQAKKSILMEMFHLTDPKIYKALRDLPPKVKITLILDSGNLSAGGAEKIRNQVLWDRPNITVYPSSGLPGGFTQTHTKAMIVDGKVALITSINLTNNASLQRDYGIKTSDRNIIKEMTSVFNADIQNSINAQNHSEPLRFTPDGVGHGNLLWSPENSESRLVSLINESSQIPAQSIKYIDATVENLGDFAIEKALSNASKNGVRVRIIVPQCVLGTNGPRNYSLFSTLTDGVQYRVMPHPSSPQNPYMHGKMLLLGNGRAYIGSVNYSANSTLKNRELGIIFTNKKVTAQMEAIFGEDWNQATEVPDPAQFPNCPATMASYLGASPFHH